MSRNSTAKYLDVLTATGHLDIRQIGNAKLYYLSPRVPIQNILRLTHEMIVMLDRHLRIVQASDSFATFTGCGRDRVLGTRLSRLPVPLLSEKEETELSALLNGGPAWVKEIRVVKNGDPVYLAARFTSVVFDGGDTGISVMVENVTEQRRAEIALMEKERFLFNVLQVSPTPQFFIDRNHKILFWNRALEIMTGFRTEDMTGTNLHWKAFYPEPRPCLADILLERDKTQSGQRQGKEDTILLNPDTGESTEFFPALGGDGTWLRCTATVMRDTGGAVTGVLEILEDVTEKKQREFQVRPGS